MNIIAHQTFDEERALYGSGDLVVEDCAFDGPADGESAFKESSNITVRRCFMNLRYPFWRDHGLAIEDCEMTESCRAALWYSDHIEIGNTKLHGIKALRECHGVSIRDCSIISPEFGWFTTDIVMERTTAESEYFMMRGANLTFSDVRFKGKYSFQYVENATFDNCTFDTKDAFWHSKNVTVRNSVVKGEYLAWYSDRLTLQNCKIIGTQPLCYATNLTLIDCEMVDCDLAFEKSQVEATVVTPIDSVKNPASGTIIAPAVGDIIRDDPRSEGKVVIDPDGRNGSAA